MPRRCRGVIRHALDMREGCPVLVSPVLGETGRGIAPDENSRRPVFPKSEKTRTGHPRKQVDSSFPSSGSLPPLAEIQRRALSHGYLPNRNSGRPHPAALSNAKRISGKSAATNIGVRARNSRDLELWILDFLNPFVAGEWLAQGPFL